MKILPQLMIFIMLFLSISAFAADPPPGPGGDPTTDPEGGTPIGGSAPVEDGHMIFIGAVLLYASYKYQKQKINQQNLKI